jgi:hypothetical protein
MKWYYFYTKDYNFWNLHLKSNLKNYFELIPIEIDNLNLNPIGKHHFNGITIKIELIIDCIIKNFGKTIIFSDCTLFINEKNAIKINKYFNQYIDYDLVFAPETIFPGNTINICLIKINCNQLTLELFKKSVDLINNNIIQWDQETIKFLLKQDEFKKLNWTMFDKNLVICSYICNNKNYYIYKQYIHNINKELNWNMRIDLLYSNKLLNLSDYKNNLIKYNKLTYQYILYYILIKCNNLINFLMTTDNKLLIVFAITLFIINRFYIKLIVSK